jgi:hypothetical protein
VFRMGKPLDFLQTALKALTLSDEVARVGMVIKCTGYGGWLVLDMLQWVNFCLLVFIGLVANNWCIDDEQGNDEMDEHPGTPPLATRYPGQSDCESAQNPKELWTTPPDESTDTRRTTWVRSRDEKDNQRHFARFD